MLVFSSEVRIVSPKNLPSKVAERRCLSNGLSILEGQGLTGMFCHLNFIRVFKAKVAQVGRLCRRKLVGPRFRMSRGAVGVMLPLFTGGVGLSRSRGVVCQVLDQAVLGPIDRVVPCMPFNGSGAAGLLGRVRRGNIVSVRKQKENAGCVVEWV